MHCSQSRYFSIMTLTGVLIAISLSAALYLFTAQRNGLLCLDRKAYPPGPQGYWYIGLWQVPTIKYWLTYVEWGKKYGESCVASSP